MVLVRQEAGGREGQGRRQRERGTGWRRRGGGGSRGRVRGEDTCWIYRLPVDTSPTAVNAAFRLPAHVTNAHPSRRYYKRY